MDVEILVEVEKEIQALPLVERNAMTRAIVKLQSFGSQLPYPHSSQVKSSQLRELRPRAGRSPWRALYQRVGNRIVVLAIVPEAMQDSRGFQRGVRLAQGRMLALEESQ